MLYLLICKNHIKKIKNFYKNVNTSTKNQTKIEESSHEIHLYWTYGIVRDICNGRLHKRLQCR